VLRLVVLDVNETLFPLDPVSERMAEIGLAGRFEAWFASVLRDGIAAAAAGRFASFGDLARHHLAVLLAEASSEAAGRSGTAALGPGPSRTSQVHARDAVDHVLAGFEHLVPHPDVAAGLQALRAADLRAVALTNGAAALARSNLDRAGLGPLLHAVHDVTEAGRWKPAPEPYRSVLTAHATDAADAAMVAVHPWDVLGGQRVGMVGAWLDRYGPPYPAAYGAPDVSASDLPGLVELLTRRPG
jgi:2-haloacid dehalogenase